MTTLATKRITAEEFAERPEPADGSKQELFRGEIVTISNVEEPDCPLSRCITLSA